MLALPFSGVETMNANDLIQAHDLLERLAALASIRDLVQAHPRCLRLDHHGVSIPLSQSAARDLSEVILHRAVFAIESDMLSLRMDLKNLGFPIPEVATTEPPEGYADHSHQTPTVN